MRGALSGVEAKVEVEVEVKVEEVEAEAGLLLSLEQNDNGATVVGSFSRAAVVVFKSHYDGGS